MAMKRLTKATVPGTYPENRVLLAKPLPRTAIAPARWHSPKAVMGFSTVQAMLNPNALSFFPSTHVFSAAEVESLFAEGQITIGAPHRYDAIFLEGTAYSQNYSYTLSYNGRVIAVLHIHYNTNTASEVRNTAVVGLSKIKSPDHVSTLSYGASLALINAARALH